VEAIGDDPRIVLTDRIFRHDEVLGLMHVCDAFVSLHRSEGVGISLAQCMLLGKPVIATNYSGNTDFMKEDNSCLVDYKLIAVGEKEYPFAKGQLWADPDVDQAAGYMHRLKQDHDYRNSISKAAKQYIQSNHHPSVIGQKYRCRLQELGLL
jgi:glycosyltransferase involved in cell wall biosynthesis